MSDASDLFTDLADFVIEVFDPRSLRTVLGAFDGGRLVFESLSKKRTRNPVFA